MAILPLNFKLNSPRSLVLMTALLLGIVIYGCSGSGDGGVATDNDGGFTGGTGIGADGVVIFWRYYTDQDGYYGSAKSVLETAGGDFVLAGSQGPGFNPADHNIRLVKSDNSGASLMQKSIALPGGSIANDILETENGDFTAVGSAGSDAARDLVLFATDAAFVQKWLETVDGGVGSDEGTALLKTADGYLSAGSSFRNDPPQQFIWLLESDENGTQGPEYLYGGPSENVGHDVVATSDGGYAIAGGSVQDTGTGVTLTAYLVKTNASGSEEWHKSYGIGRLYSLRQTADHGYIMTGINAPWEGEPHSTNDLLVIKTDAAGNEVWRKSFGGADVDVGKKVLITGDGDYIVVGTTQSFSSGDEAYQRQDFYLIKLDADGNTIWQKVKGMDGSSEYAETAALTSDGGFIVAGSGYGQMVAAKFDANGDTITLGDKDFTLTVPESSTVINYTNAKKVAGASITALTLPQQIGSFTLERFISALEGDLPSAFCTGGGSYSWSPAVSNVAPGTGETHTLNLASCITGSGIDQLTYDGNTTLTFNQNTSGALNTASYDVNLTVSGISMTLQDSAGMIGFEGATQFSRNAAGGTFSELAQQALSPLSKSESGSALILQQYRVHDTVTGTAYTLGQNGESSRFTMSSIGADLTTAVEAPIAGSDVNAPVSGTFSTTAEDNSTLKLTVTNGTAAITVDMDADGVTDFSTTALWEDLN